jgi:hypothetical protein
VRHGWTEGDTHQIDHVQDLFWTGPDENHNLWPLNSETNNLAGNRFMNFRVTYSNVPGGGPATPATTNVRLTDGLRAPGVNNLLRRWFIIRSIQPREDRRPERPQPSVSVTTRMSEAFG